VPPFTKVPLLVMLLPMLHTRPVLWKAAPEATVTEPQDGAGDAQPSTGDGGSPGIAVLARQRLGAPGDDEAAACAVEGAPIHECAGEGSGGRGENQGPAAQRDGPVSGQGGNAGAGAGARNIEDAVGDDA